jgi:excisionase family DNA binding protein
MVMNPDDTTTGAANGPRAFGLTKATYSVNETLDLLSIGRTTFYGLVERGDLKIAKLGTKSLIYAIDLAALLTKLRELPDPSHLRRRRSREADGTSGAAPHLSQHPRRGRLKKALSAAEGGA